MLLDGPDLAFIVRLERTADLRIVGGDECDVSGLLGAVFGADVVGLLPWLADTAYVVRAWRGEQLVGVCFLNEVGDYADGLAGHAHGLDAVYYVDRLCVAAGARRRGVGAAMLGAIRDAGLLTVLYVDKTRDGTHDRLAAWYERHGYHRVAEPARLRLDAGAETLFACAGLLGHPRGV